MAEQRDALTKLVRQRDALTELVQEHVGTHKGRKWSVEAFAERAVDPDTGYSPSTGLIGKIVQGQSYRITADLVGALAAGLELPRSIVAAAAHYQLIGYEESELQGGAPATLLHRIGERPEETPKAAAIAERWKAEEDASGS
ncbi:hypothetical protein AB0H03_06495 [Streptomyces sparsogenes]|uniref:hypothetical protein n=1 Tax=Streptomyces sparsogenes TaxID=67365 RepID=UPI0033C414F1